MKRIPAILLTVILAFTLIACNSGNTGTSPSTAPSAAPSSAAPLSPSPSAAPSPSPSEKDTVGFITDKADHWNRKPYKIASMALNTASTYTQMINDNFTKWGTVFNYETVIYNANMDYDGYINQIQVYADQHFDALLTGMDIALVPRIYELTQELKMPVVGMPTAFTDLDGHIIWPSVQQDDNGNSSMGMQWLNDNYKNYWKDPLDATKLGLIVITFSPVSGINDRVPGFENTFKKLFPDAAKNYYLCDLITNSNGFSNQVANEMTSATISAHTEVTKWFIATCVDDWAVGAERAVESLGKNADVLIVSDQADAFINEMSSGPANTSYVAGCAISTTELTGYCAANLAAILEGRATAETIWPEYIKAGDKYPCVFVKGTIITKDTYKDWVLKTSFEEVAKGMKKG
jgi:ABC-type sugar transport system substrate-binding protein